MKRAFAYIVSFSAALLLGMFVISTWLEFALVTALFSLAAIGANFGHTDSKGERRTGKSQYGNYESTVHLGKSPRKADRYDIFTDD